MSVWDDIKVSKGQKAGGGTQAGSPSGSSASKSDKKSDPVDEQSLLPDTLKARYRVEARIGRGAFANALLVKEIAGTEKYVAKVMNTATMTPKDKEHVKSEVDCLAKCDHINIIRHKETYSAGSQMVLVVEYADGGDLGKEIRVRQQRSNSFSETEICIIIAQLGLAIDHVHSLDILHRDIKPANIFFTRKGLIKLGDFGLSKAYEDSVSNAVGSTVCGTPYYVSPEMWSGEKYNKSSDVWAIGIVMYELMALQPPFRGETIRELAGNVRKGELPPIPAGAFSANLMKTCASILTTDCTVRPTLGDMLRMPVFQSALRTILDTMQHETYAGDTRTQAYISQIKKYLAA
eukprot:PhF_6_TR627/c0_g1_i1/m.841/K08857/NEK1_4_5; NIMA (never in mitosis gene a)-related kinase 1/4/5